MVWNQAEQAKLTSDEHFTVDGTLLKACASLKSFRRKGSGRPEDPDEPGNPTVDFHGETRCNQTHESTTDGRYGGGNLYRSRLAIPKICDTRTRAV